MSMSISEWIEERENAKRGAIRGITIVMILVGWRRKT